jgi:hypothetical protein
MNEQIDFSRKNRMSARQTAFIDKHKRNEKNNSQRGTTNIEYSVIKILFSSSSSSSASPSTSAIGRKEKNKRKEHN